MKKRARAVKASYESLFDIPDDDDLSIAEERFKQVESILETKDISNPYLLAAIGAARNELELSYRAVVKHKRRAEQKQEENQSLDDAQNNIINDSDCAETPDTGSGANPESVDKSKNHPNSCDITVKQELLARFEKLWNSGEDIFTPAWWKLNQSTVNGFIVIALAITICGISCK